ncbi:MAG: lamin tail domain-containing protein [Pirellulaceae bacterium]
MVINEFMASNESTVPSPRGKFSDWIELANRSGKAVDVSGMYLSDNAHSVQKWKIPEGTVIAPGGYLLIWADEKKSKEGDLHCNFKLAAEGEQIFLSDTDARGNQLLDYVKFGAQDKDVAFGRTADGQQWRSLVPTPGSQNRESK